MKLINKAKAQAMKIVASIVLMLTPSLCFAQANAHMLAGVNAQIGTSYTIQAADQIKLTTFNNASPVAVTLPAATTTNFGAGTLFAVKNLGAGLVTITTPPGTLIDNTSTLLLTQGQGADIYSDGTNYYTQKGAGVSSLTGMSAAQVPIAATATTVASSKAIQGSADTGILGAGTVSGVNSPLCTDANGGATTVGCPSGGGSPAGSDFQTQVHNGAAFGATPCFNVSTPASLSALANLDCDTHPTGPNPSVDITRYGARFVTTTPVASGVTCTGGSNQVTVGTVTGTFVVGDYVFGAFCGATNSMAAVAAPTVTSGASAMQTVPDAIINAAIGTSSYSYLVVTKDFNGGLTVPSTTTTITNGVPIGQQTAAVTNVVQAGQNLTITLSSNGPPNGTLFHLTYIAQGAGQINHKFDGYYNICSGGGTTSIVVCNMPFYSQNSDATAASIIWFQGNQVKWVNQVGPPAPFAQYICGKRPGDLSFHFLGSSFPASGAGTPPTVWVDWGNTVTPASPTGIPEGGDAICTLVSNRNDYLDNVKITACTASCGTGSTWTLSANVPNSASGVVLQQDSAPALTAANTANVNVGVGLTIPCSNISGAQMNFFSPQYLTSLRNWVDQCGSLNINETIDLGNVTATTSIPWTGRTQSQINSNAQNIFFNAYPALNNVGILNNIVFNASGNDSSLAVIENTGQVSNGNQTPMFDHNQFFGGGFGSIAVLTIGIFPFGYITNTHWQYGPSNSPSNYDATWTPVLYMESSSELHLLNSYGFGRGTYVNETSTAGPLQLDIEQHYVQGSIMPTLGVYGAPGTSLFINTRQWVSDTSPQPMISMQTNPANPFSIAHVRFRDMSGLPVNTITGWSPSDIWDENGTTIPGFSLPSYTFPDNLTNFGRLSVQTATKTDNFNRGSLGSNWVNQLNTISITSNQVLGTNAGWNVAYDLGTTPLPNVNGIATGGEFCDATVTNYGGGAGGCSVLVAALSGATGVGYACEANGSTVSIVIPNSLTITGPTSYTGGGVGDRLYGTATIVPGAANVSLSCTVFPVNGAAVTITGTDANYHAGFPGVNIFGTATIVDNFSGGTINPIVYENVENAYQAPQHLLSGTVGNSTPIPGTLPFGYWSSSTMQAANWVSAEGANSAYDGFNRANGGLGGNWVTIPGYTAPTITSNQVLGNTATTRQAAVYTASSFSADQFSQITAPVGGNNASGGVTALCRGSITAGTFYELLFINGNFFISRSLSGTITTIAGPVVGTLLSGDALRIECTGFPATITGFQISGGVKTQIVQITDSNIPNGFPGFDVFGNVAQSVVDNWSGGNINTLSQPTVEEDVLGNRHFMNAITLGITVPAPGALGPGIYNTLWSPSSSICTDTNSKLVTTGCAGGSISGMTAGQLAVAGSASSITSSKAIQGTDANILSSSTVAAGTGNPLCTDTGSGATTTGCPNLSGMTATQIPVAGSATTVTSSKAQQGTDTSILTSGTVSGTGATLCTDANGGATTVGCTGGSISGLTAGGVAIAGTATTITSSKPQQGTDANILTSGTISANTPALLCTDANSGATTANCSAYNTQSAATNTNIAATNMVASVPTANTLYMYMWTISLTTVGTGCTSTTSVVLNVIFTDPSAAGSVTESLGQISIAPGGNGTLGFVAQGVDNIYAKSGTAVQYSTSGYTPGTGCTVNPSYQVTMRLIPIS